MRSRQPCPRPPRRSRSHGEGREAGASRESGPQTWGLVSRRPGSTASLSPHAGWLAEALPTGTSQLAPRGLGPASFPVWSPWLAAGADSHSEGRLCHPSPLRPPTPAAVWAELGRPASPPTRPGPAPRLPWHSRWRRGRPHRPSDRGLTPRVHPGCPHTPHPGSGRSWQLTHKQGHLLWGRLRGQVGHLLGRRNCAGKTGKERGDRPAPSRAARTGSCPLSWC